MNEAWELFYLCVITEFMEQENNKRKQQACVNILTQLGVAERMEEEGILHTKWEQLYNVLERLYGEAQTDTEIEVHARMIQLYMYLNNEKATQQE